MKINFMQKAVTFLESISERVGKVFAWTTSLMVWLICLDVLMRYLFNFTLIWIVELEIYFFALTFLFGGAYAFKHDKHVRVDVFYANYSPKRKAWVNLIGGLLFLVPWCLVAIIVCWRYFMFSWTWGETSAQPGGLPAVYVLKFCLFMGFVFLLIQGIASILKSILIIKNEGIDYDS